MRRAYVNFPVCISQLKSDFAAASMLEDTQRVVCRSHGSCWGGGTARVLMSLELKQVSLPA